MRSTWFVVTALAALPMLMASTCGGDDAPEYISAYCFNNPGHDCVTDADCDDDVFCNGQERCMPGNSEADGCGCMRASPATPCGANETCNEAMLRCEMCRTDADGDGHTAPECGGDDCDDNDPNRFPGNTEVCDEASHDEDCDAYTYGALDMDGDQFDDARCCNTETDVVSHCGMDCDDTNPAVVPGAQRCQKAASTDVEICDASGQWSAPQACMNAGTCVVQPNGLGVCE
jgi:hypothetical protein